MLVQTALDWMKRDFQFPLESFITTTPEMMRNAPSQRPKLAASLKNTTPTKNAPAAPMPVQTA